MIKLFFIFQISFFSIISSCAKSALSENPCGKFIKAVSRQVGVLPEIIWAVAKTESNRGDGPWPWSLNVSGRSFYFSNKKLTQIFLKNLSKKRLKATDIGCMQLNYQYHGGKFKNVIEMLNPQHNILIASRFLKELYRKKNSWSKAIGDYHSKKKLRGSRYSKKVFRNFQTDPKWWQ